jgi:hypothetical protein
MRRALLPRVLTRPRIERDRVPLAILPYRPARRRDSQLELFARAKKAVRGAHKIGCVRRWLRFGWRGLRWEGNPEKAARSVVLRLASKAMPRGIRDALWLLRDLRGIGSRQR